MAQDSSDKIILLPQFPMYNSDDPDIAAELEKIYNTINILAERAGTLVGGEDYTQEQRQAFWLEGNTVNCRLAIASRKLVKYVTAASPGDIVIEYPGSVRLEVPEYWVPTTGTVPTSGNWRPFGMCIDSVAAGQVAYVYIKGVVPFTRFSLDPGAIYGVYHDTSDGPLNSMFKTGSVDYGASNNNISMVGTAISTNSILLQMQQYG